MSGIRVLVRLARVSTLRPVVMMPRRFKYTQHQGVKGIRNRKSFFEAQMQAGQRADDHDEEETLLSADLTDVRFLDDR